MCTDFTQELAADGFWKQCGQKNDFSCGSSICDTPSALNVNKHQHWQLCNFSYSPFPTWKRMLMRLHLPLFATYILTLFINSTLIYSFLKILCCRFDVYVIEFKCSRNILDKTNLLWTLVKIILTLFWYETYIYSCDIGMWKPNLVYV